MITAMSGVLGSLVGGAATFMTAWVSQRTVNRRELVHEEIRKREAIYGEFISECAKLAVDAATHSLQKIDSLLPAYALVNRIRLCGSEDVLIEAERVLWRITDQYFLTNLTVEELRQRAMSDDADPLKAFGKACRVELKSLHSRI